MTKRSYIKSSGGHQRMRFVQAGYDVDSEAVPPNKVIFDSDDVGTLSLIASGIYRLARYAGDPPPAVVIASWSLDYVPLCTFQFKGYGGTYWTPYYIPGVTSYIEQNRIVVSRTGIEVQVAVSTPQYVDIAWQAYRLIVV